MNNKVAAFTVSEKSSNTTKIRRITQHWQLEMCNTDEILTFLRQFTLYYHIRISTDFTHLVEFYLTYTVLNRGKGKKRAAAPRKTRGAIIVIL